MLPRILAFALLWLQVTAAGAAVFGSSLFTGNFRDQQFTGFNPDYQIAVGDKVAVRLWGAFTFEGSLVVDPLGNIFIPSVGPVKLLGVRNAELNAAVATQAQRVFRQNVGVYASLEVSQPVKVFVTGFVQNPGLYGGVASDSVLFYLDKARGVDLDRGSFIDISILRNGQLRKRVNLYDFLLDGKLDLVQFADGDVIVVGPRKKTMTVSGDVYNAYDFEFEGERISVEEALRLARAKPGATHVNIVRRQGPARTSEHYAIQEIRGIQLQDGDEMIVMTDRYPETILVRVEGAHRSEHSFVVPYGSRLGEILTKVVPNRLSNMDAVQLFRKTLAAQQKEMLLRLLQTLETQALTARSATGDEAKLRAQEAELVLKFIERAKSIEPRGQIVLANSEVRKDTILEDGDIIRIPELTSVVTVNGEVLFPTAFGYQPGRQFDHYIRQAGGYTQNAETSRVLIQRPNGAIDSAPGDRTNIEAGDQIMVLPRYETKNLEFAKAISQIVYQIAIATAVVIDILD